MAASWFSGEFRIGTRDRDEHSARAEEIGDENLSLRAIVRCMRNAGQAAGTTRRGSRVARGFIRPNLRSAVDHCWIDWM